jgi:hypothetical protein
MALIATAVVADRDRANRKRASRSGLAPVSEPDFRTRTPPGTCIQIASLLPGQDQWRDLDAFARFDHSPAAGTALLPHRAFEPFGQHDKWRCPWRLRNQRVGLWNQERNEERAEG